MTQNSEKTVKKKRGKGKPFQPGQSGNPGGRPLLPEDVREAKILDKIQFSRSLHKLMHLPDGELDSILHDPNAAALDKIVARIVLEAIEKGDHFRLEFLLNRLIGKVKDEVEHTLPEPCVITRMDGTEIILGLKQHLENHDGDSST